MDFLRLSDTISSKQGSAYITINGSNQRLFEISSLKAQLDMNVIGRNMLGHKMMQHKVAGVEGTGSMTMYFMNSEMLNLALEYIGSGKFGNITLVVTNEDASSTIGKQEVILSNVLIKTILVSNLDDQSDDPITVETEFTFDSISAPTKFSAPQN